MKAKGIIIVLLTCGFFFCLDLLSRLLKGDKNIRGMLLQLTSSLLFIAGGVITSLTL